MGWLDDLITGRGPRLETRSLPTIAPEQQEALNRLLQTISGRQPTQYQGQLNAGLSPFERSSLTALEERSRALAQPDQNLQAAGGAVRDAMDVERNTGDASEFFRTNVQDPLTQDFNRSILPQISRNFGGGSFFSSERQAAEGLAREDLLEALAGEKTAVELDQFNRARDRSLTAAQIAPQLSRADLDRGNQQMDILNAAGLERRVEQEGLDRNYADFIRQLQERTGNEELLRALALTPTIENIGMTDPGNAGLLNTLLGSLAGGLGENLGNGLFDRLLQRGGGASADGATPNVRTPRVGGAGGAGLGDLVNGVQPGINAGINETALAGQEYLASLAQPNASIATPGGTSTIYEGANLDQLASQLGSGGLGSISGSLAAGAHTGAMSGVAGTTAATQASLLGGAAPTLAPISTGAGGGAAGGALGGGASADAAGAAAGGGMSAGLAASLGVAALPLAIFLAGGFNNPAHSESAQLNRAYSGLGLTPIRTRWGQNLIQLPDRTFIAADGITSSLDDRWGKEPKESLLAWLNSQPRVQYTIPRLSAPPSTNPNRTPETFDRR